MKKKRFNNIARDIKNLKIQGAKNIAKKALQAYFLIPTKNSKKKLLSLRPTEPLLKKVLTLAEKNKSSKEILNHLNNSQEKINKFVFKLIKKQDIIFTHCHSSTLVNALIYSRKKGKIFQVYNTETRPLFQGRKTFRELSKAGIKVTQFVDSAAQIALTKKQGTKKVNKIFFGSDAILKKGVINKVGSGMFANVAFSHKIPVYILADSWKFTKENIKLEKRSFKEIWKKVLINKNKIENPCFEFIPKKYIKVIISELGNLSYEEFLKKVN